MRVINAVLKFFTKAKAKPTDTPTTALESLQNAYMKFLENFNYEHYINTRQEVLKGIKDEIQERKYKVDSSEPSFTYTTGEAKGIAELRKDLKQALEPYKSTPITNKETGLQGVVTDTERNKISSKKAVDKSIANGFTRDEHFAAAQDLKNLFENATKKTSYADKKHSKDILSMHRFFTQITINNKQAQAKMTLKESIEYGNRIYSLGLEELSKAKFHP